MKSLEENMEEEKKRRGQIENPGDLKHYTSSDRKSLGGRLRKGRWRGRAERNGAMKDKNGASRKESSTDLGRNYI